MDGKVWDKAKFDFYPQLCQPKQPEGFCAAVVMAEGERSEHQRTPQRALGVQGWKWGEGRGSKTERDETFNQQIYILLHCRNILPFDLVGGFGETFFILPLLANHFAGKLSVQQTWKHPPRPWDVKLLQLQFWDLRMVSGNKQQFPHCLTRRWCRCLKSLHRDQEH